MPRADVGPVDPHFISAIALLPSEDEDMQNLLRAAHALGNTPAEHLSDLLYQPARISFDTSSPGVMQRRLGCKTAAE